MQRLHCTHPDYISIVLIELPTAAKAVDAPFKPFGVAKIQHSKSMLKSSLEGIGMLAIGGTMGVHHNRNLLLVIRSCPKATRKQPTGTGLLLHRSR